MARPTNEESDRAFESMLRIQEGILARKLNANFNKLSADLQRALEVYDVAGAEALISMNDIALNIILLEAYEAGNRQGARMTARDIEEDDDTLLEEAVLLALLLWRTSTADKVSREINRTTKKIFDKIREQTIQDLTVSDEFGSMKPPTIGDLAKEVAKRTKAENKRRSGTISTTEAQRGIQTGSNQAGISVQQKIVKQWRTQGDRRVRDTHRRANGQTVDMNETFKVGRGRGRYPTDSMLPKDESINCRCYMRLRKIDQPIQPNSP